METVEVRRRARSYFLLPQSRALGYEQEHEGG